MKKLTRLALIVLILNTLYLIPLTAQVGINNDNSEPDASAMLDVKSDSKGVLIPRMSSSDRQQILDPAVGLMVYDSTAQAFYYFNGMGWLELLSNSVTLLEDNDGDTKIQVEESADEDVIRFDLEGTEAISIQKSSAGRTLLDFPNNNSSIFLGTNSGIANTTGADNVFLGVDAGRSNTTGNYNVFLGDKTGDDNTTGDNNTFVGAWAGDDNITGNNNTFIGTDTGTENTEGEENTFVGVGAGASNTTGYYNTYLGYEAGYDNEIGEGNVALGYYAGYNFKGSYNIFLGYEAGQDETGSNKLYIENSDAASPLIYGEFDNDLIRINGDLEVTGSFPTSNIIADGDGDTKIDLDEGGNDDDEVSIDLNGNQSFRMTRGSISFLNSASNIYIGDEAGKSDNFTGGSNIGIGANALSGNSSGSNNTAIGTSANVDASNLTNATAIGAGALVSQSNALVLGNNANVGIGTSTPNEKLHVVGNIKMDNGRLDINNNGNIFIGDSGTSNTTGTNNIALGEEAFTTNTDGERNIAIGYQALNKSDEDQNIAIGHQTLKENISGADNIALGYQTLTKNTSGQDNVGIGYLVLGNNTTGSNNLGLANFALNANTEGVYNYAIGNFSLVLNTTGDFNTALGNNTLQTNTTGSQNTALGNDADVMSNNLSHATAIGANAKVACSDCLVLGDPTNISVGIGTNTPQEELHVVGNLRLEDGSEQSGYVLTSDGNGVGTWQESSASDDQTIDNFALNGTTLELSLENDGQANQTVDLSNLAVPVGSMMMWMTATPPTGWVICDGQDITAYPQLVAVLGSNNAPDFRDKFPYGAGPFRGLGTSGGRESVTLSEANIPKHSHDAGTLKTTYLYKSNDSNAGSASNKDGSDVQFYNGNDITGNTGEWGGASNGLTQSFEIIPFYRTVNFIIKAE